MPADITQWKTRASDSECIGDLNSLDAEGKLSCRIATCVESMEHVTFANPAKETCEDIQGCIMLTGDMVSVSSFGLMCDTPNWKNGLNQILTAVAVLDADPMNTLTDINTLFSSGTDFTGINYQTGDPVLDTTNCPNTNRRTLAEALEDQANRKLGIITGGLIVPGLERFKYTNSLSEEAETISWWDTTLAWTTTESPDNSITFNKNPNRGIETIDEAPSFTSFNEVMEIATSGTNIAWDSISDSAITAFCTVNPCLACETHAQTKLISTPLPDGRTSTECICPAIVTDSDQDGIRDTQPVTAELAHPIYAQVRRLKNTEYGVQSKALTVSTIFQLNAIMILLDCFGLFFKIRDCTT